MEGNVRDQWQEGDGGSNAGNEIDMASADVNRWSYDTDVMQEESPGLSPLEVCNGGFPIDLCSRVILKGFSEYNLHF